MALELTDSNFQELVKNSDKPVLVDFWATWCGPCLAIAPTIEQLATEYEGKVVIGKLNVDANGVTSSEYSVRSIPTLLIFKNGQVVDKLIGAVSKTEIARKLELQLA